MRSLAQVIFGGRDKDQFYDDVWAFDLNSLFWEQWGLDSMERPSARNHLGGFSCEGLIYAYGTCFIPRCSCFENCLS